MNFKGGQTGSGKPPRLSGKLRARLAYKISEWCLCLLWRIQGGRFLGKLNESPVVVVANHGSYLDWLLLHIVVRRTLGRNIRFIAKEKVARSPWFGLLVEAANAIVLQEDHKTRALALAVRELNQVENGNIPAIGLFPEGTRSQSGERLVCSSGASWLARKCKVPIVPVALCGFWEVWPPQHKLPSLRRIGLTIRVLPPVNPSDFPDDQAAVDYAIGQCYETVRCERDSRRKSRDNP